MNNAFTVDVEDYFQVAAFADQIEFSSWGARECRVERNTTAILDMLARRDVKGTFFVLGWIAKRYPALVREIAARGHEIASHGMNHQLIYNQSEDEFRAETRDSKRLLEDVCQRPVFGYRAATYSITLRSLWALDILAEEGFVYDSSIFPMRHDRYGIPEAKLIPHQIETQKGNRIVEFPISVLRYRGITIPVAGGGYFRLLPYAITRWALKKLNTVGQEFVFYIHPWEIDPTQPRIENASVLSKFRHYLNLQRCESRLDDLLGDFRFTPLVSILKQRGLLAEDGDRVRIA